MFGAYFVQSVSTLNINMAPLNLVYSKTEADVDQGCQTVDVLNTGGLHIDRLTYSMH